MKIKVILCSCLCLLLISSTVVPAFAKNDNAEIPSDYSKEDITYLSNEEARSFLTEQSKWRAEYESIKCSTGDVDCDGHITASDARLCLRTATKLEKLTDEQHKNASVDGQNLITSADARKILRVAAKLESFDYIEHVKVGDTLNFGPIRGASNMYKWKCETSDSSNITSTITSPNIRYGDLCDVGAPVTFHFTPKKTGIYHITMSNTLVFGTEVIDEIHLTIVAEA